MSARADSGTSTLDTVKLIAAVAAFLAGIIAFYYFEDQQTLVRVGGMVAVAVASLGLAASTSQGRGAIGFAREARQELRKVIWPTRQETVQTALIVVAMVIVVGIILWILDWMFVQGIELLLGLGG